ncbi:hypothetical protein SAMN02745174_02334 [Cetobacterium ceti]|uniref:Uncharacterized protein n=1 Tax=Cetobacterium ceti TaxID=180163 RepID=A0A1T4QI90_9FUSO|nr:hypothetical protein [Cetobacterium ceti]SKA03412.1 hypothetical protein SAMN02745174_02334 [Cetobacterium ceti]
MKEQLKRIKEKNKIDKIKKIDNKNESQGIYFFSREEVFIYMDNLLKKNHLIILLQGRDNYYEIIGKEKNIFSFIEELEKNRKIGINTGLFKMEKLENNIKCIFKIDYMLKADNAIEKMKKIKKKDIFYKNIRELKVEERMIF